MPTSRAEALAVGAPRYFTGQPCKHGHITERFAYGVCVECNNAWNKRRTQLVKGTAKEKERCKLKAAREREANRELCNERTRLWRAKNPNHGKEYRKKHLARYAAHATKRHAGLKTATPAWSEEACIFALYNTAARLRSASADVQIDHITPLKGKTVSGLHVRNNLRIIPSVENRSKNNRFVEVLT